MATWNSIQIGRYAINSKLALEEQYRVNFWDGTVSASTLTVVIILIYLFLSQTTKVNLNLIKNIGQLIVVWLQKNIPKRLSLSFGGILTNVHGFWKKILQKKLKFTQNDFLCQSILFFRWIKRLKKSTEV